MAAAGRAAVAVSVRRKKMERKAEEETEMVRSWFEKYDTSRNGVFEREEMKALLNEVKRNALNDPNAEVKDKLLDRVMKKYSTVSEERQVPGIDRANASKAVQKYKAWMKWEETLTDLFAAADRDHSGVLTREQLKEFLRSAGEMRGNFGGVSDDDVDFILERCDASKDGTINLEEAGPAVALWYTCLPPPSSKSVFSCCFPSGNGKKTAKVAASS